ncbi:MAG: aminotransferase class I/II-fold pyridoxal phosphate-dependent enzyme [Candidatus Obscuribacterales bacterium]|nr:aminotransferase class I/II-fold pyridoxal phosphate-dependent enzyme [Candidatus Obscuribacterales bacterium]
MRRHLDLEAASFHTPGHKGRLSTLSPDMPLNAAFDLTELPGLDELSDPAGPIARIEASAAQIYGAAASFLSVQGATGAIMAAVAATAGSGDSILLPRHCHRSVLQALSTTNLKPVWYEADFDQEWQIYRQVQPETIKQAIFEAEKSGKLALTVVVSPTYTGDCSNLREIAAIVHEHGHALLVDEAHGSHLSPSPALRAGADLVAQSLHKTLTALTQTGLLHVGYGCAIEKRRLKEELSRVTSSSPSYLLLASIEAALALVSQGKLLEQLEKLSFNLYRDLLRLSRDNQIEVLAADEDALKDLQSFRKTVHERSYAHILIKPKEGSSQHLFNYLIAKGIYAEAIFGKGVLLMLGLGSEVEDCGKLVQALKEYRAEAGQNDVTASFPSPLKFKLTPQQASQCRQILVSRREALGRISAQLRAPCPPGIPILVPGQEITKEVLERSRLDEFLVVVG